MIVAMSADPNASSSPPPTPPTTSDPSSGALNDSPVDDRVRYEITAGIATITLNNPEGKNALSVAMVNALGDRLVEAGEDDDVRAIVLTNTGNTFCAGADLKAATPGVAGVDEARWSFIQIMTMIMESPKPVLGRADGHATGGGVGLLAACDVSVMRDDAKIGFTEARLGVAPAVISVVCLPKMRRADASELFLTAERFTPQRAVDVGLVNAAVGPDQLDATIEEYLGKILQGGPLALAACKELINAVPAMTTAEAFAYTGPLSAELFQSAEAQAGIAAFRARTPAPWIPS